MTSCSIRKRLRYPLALTLLCLTCMAGCDKSARRLSLNKDLARSSCKEFLTAWQEGKKPDDLKPKIIVNDFACQAGQKLVAFELMTEETSDGTNLNIPARLTLKNAEGVESKADVVYIVGTSPAITVVRANE